MKRFNTGGFPIVRIENRMFKYIKEMGLIMGYDPSLSNLGFEEKVNTFRRKVAEDEIESAYYVNSTIGIYLDYKVSVLDYKEETKEILIRLNNADGKAAGFSPKIDVFDKNNEYYEEYVPEKDMKEIYEIRKPEDGFVFESPRIVFHMKDGKWIPRHRYGSLLDENVWL